jgi:hypothetical protein
VPDADAQHDAKAEEDVAEASEAESQEDPEGTRVRVGLASLDCLSRLPRQ